MYAGKYFTVGDFKGGYAGNLPATQVGLNQAYSLDNIVLKPEGKGWRTIHGTMKYHLALLVVQDITYTATDLGAAGTEVTIAYVAGGTAGAEVVTVTDSAISIEIEDGVSTATQVKAAYDASAAAVALATAAITGTAGDAQAAAGATALAIAALNSGANVQGIGFLKQADQDKWLAAIVGTKFYTSSEYSGTWTDSTGAYAGITAGAAYRWSLMTFNDALVGFGGLQTSPDAALTWTGTGAVAALSGAPAAYGGFTANNRVFAYRTSADPSTISWSIIGSASDWSGAGSGSATIGSLSDNQTITAAVVISTNYVLVFKENSVHQMVISSAPFPVYSLFDNVGTPGKTSVVNVDGIVYFITSRGEMRSTNGETITEYPPLADDLWNSVQPSQYKNIVGFRESNTDKDWLVWCVSTTGTTNDVAIIWDLQNQCWLRCTTGYAANVAGQDDVSNVYLGSYTGYVYTPDTVGVYYNQASTAPGTITSYWRSGWIVPENIDKITQIRKFSVVYEPKTAGTITLNYGYDGIADGSSTTFAQTAVSTEIYGQKSAILSGRGNTFQYKLSQSSTTVDMEVNSIILSGKTSGQKNQVND